VLSGVCLIGFAHAGCGGRSHAEVPDGGGSDAPVAMTGLGGTGGGGNGGVGGIDGGADSSADTSTLSCGAMKACPAAALCVAATGCCDATDCPTRGDGKTGSCDTATHICSYDCATGTKSCNGTCIPTIGCCVDSDCPGVCRQCAANYVCATVTSQDDPSGHCSGTCDGKSQCKSKQGQHCTTATAGGCVTAAQCVDDYCCNSACSSSCMACDVAGSEGMCTAVLSGMPHGTRACGAASCSGTNEVTGPATCASGTCTAPTAQTCVNNFACAANACKTTCAANADCQTGFSCSGGTCYRALKVVAGDFDSCALLTDGTVHCWGQNEQFVLGNPAVGFLSAKPVPISGIANAIDLAAGRAHLCALIQGGTVKCWGDNSQGQLGSGAGVVNASAAPITVPAVTGATAIFAGFSASCAVVAGGTVECWGNVAFRGDGTAVQAGPGVFSVPSLANVTQVAIGLRHLCAIVSGTVECWGDNTGGQTGVPLSPSDPSTTQTLVPTSVALSASSIAAGSTLSCASSPTGVMCWGNGPGYPGTPMTATTIAGLSGPSGVSIGGDGTHDYYACGLLVSGVAKCWGSNTVGELGLDPATTAYLSAPAGAVSGLTSATSLSAGMDHACVAADDGTVRCWGSNMMGELGLDHDRVGFQFTPNVIAAW
jgi:Regulator of chromosome condensation (RCC1) repeat